MATTDPSRLTQARERLQLVADASRSSAASEAGELAEALVFSATACDMGARALALVESLSKSENLQGMMDCYQRSRDLLEGQ